MFDSVVDNTSLMTSATGIKLNKRLNQGNWTIYNLDKGQDYHPLLKEGLDIMVHNTNIHNKIKGNESYFKRRLKIKNDNKIGCVSNKS